MKIGWLVTGEGDDRPTFYKENELPDWISPSRAVRIAYIEVIDD